MTTPDLLDLGDLVADARNVAELILMAHRAPVDTETKAVAAAAHQITGILDRVQEGLAAHARPDASKPIAAQIERLTGEKCQ